MRKTKWVIFSTFVFLLALLVLQNNAPVKARFLWFAIEVPESLLLLLTSAGGFMLGLLVVVFAKGGVKIKL